MGREECLRDFLSSFYSLQCQAEPALLADVSSSTLTAPPAFPPFILPLSSFYPPPPLSCMPHSCTSTPCALGLICHECVLKEPPICNGLVSEHIKAALGTTLQMKTHPVYYSNSVIGAAAELRIHPK